MKTQAMIVNNLTDGGKPATCEISVEGRMLFEMKFREFTIQVNIDDVIRTIEENDN